MNRKQFILALAVVAMIAGLIGCGLFMPCFFGNLSPFEIIVAVVAFLTGFYTLYKSFLEGPRIAIYPAEYIGLVVEPDGKKLCLNLPCNIVNTGSKVGTLLHLEANVLSPSGVRYVLAWRQFYRYKEGGGEQDKVSDTYPVSINQHDSRLLFIQFRLFSPEGSIDWIEGDYECGLYGWVNLQNRRQKANVTRQFYVEIDKNVAVQLSLRTNQHVVYNVPVQEWATVANLKDCQA